VDSYSLTTGLRAAERVEELSLPGDRVLAHLAEGEGQGLLTFSCCPLLDASASRAARNLM
jgi:hypothetical protein